MDTRRKDERLDDKTVALVTAVVRLSRKYPTPEQMNDEDLDDRTVALVMTVVRLSRGRGYPSPEQVDDQFALCLDAVRKCRRSKDSPLKESERPS